MLDTYMCSDGNEEIETDCLLEAYQFACNHAEKNENTGMLEPQTIFLGDGSGQEAKPSHICQSCKEFIVRCKA